MISLAAARAEHPELREPIADFWAARFGGATAPLSPEGDDHRAMAGEESAPATSAAVVQWRLRSDSNLEEIARTEVERRLSSVIAGTRFGRAFLSAVRSATFFCCPAAIDRFLLLLEGSCAADDAGGALI